MKTYEQCQQQVAIEQGFESWSALRGKYIISYFADKEEEAKSILIYEMLCKLVALAFAAQYQAKPEPTEDEIEEAYRKYRAEFFATDDFVWEDAIKWYREFRGL